ncbi:hypothetical protein FG609_025605 [Salmonella enterica subsp. enterica serovar Typhimurium]|nr:hypothetical protein [Salmonella enterica subsp. enterica serovar Typhimurium]EDG8239035.1 hypothetical protein [Salmonella enterica subsp. enterica serovar Typhimurium]EDG8247104.1 hypothetical protein [Salmonella enterica subsp. enterica serovar Typhimurium]EDH0633789.1 hypothetical protein [Salmonella enterica subsp. enterica serovar Typhimurium]TRI86085.1 hypothetical protein FG610_022405 [Salmonella enterica subsp. enterica serovar Typhimurium]
MKLYMTIGEVFKYESLLARAEIADTSEIEPAVAYLFLASYAELTVRSIVNGLGKGENFLTFIPPDPALILEQLRGMWGTEKVLPLNCYSMSSGIKDEVRFYEILSVIERVWGMAGLTPEDGAKKTKVSLLMNEIGNALICVEC